MCPYCNELPVSRGGSRTAPTYYGESCWMKAFRRIFKYIWPQWPRLIVVFSTAIIVAILLSVSLMTIIPLMKVMLGQEGLHGWVDRKACDWKYGVDIYLPDAADITTGRAQEMTYSLLVTGVEKDSLAHLAGLQNADKIVGVGRHLPTEDDPNVLASKMLEEMATNKEGRLVVQVKRYDQNDEPKLETLTLNTASNKSYIADLDWNIRRRVRWSLKLALAEKAP